MYNWLRSAYAPKRRLKVAVCCPYFGESLAGRLVKDLQVDNPTFLFWALDAVVPPALARHTRGQGRLPRLEVFNRLSPLYRNADMVLFVNDDVVLGPGFLSRFLPVVTEFGGDIAQPALTLNSYYSHPITRAHTGLKARQTTFVEVGPVVLMTRKALDLVLPFPVPRVMSWGVDFLWARIAREAGLRMLIVDSCPVEHSTRPVGALYCVEEAKKSMQEFMEQHRLTPPEQQVLQEFC
jgi:hypothetical protein